MNNLLKYLETIKYLEKANSTIKILLKKVKFSKIRELLLIINEDFDNKYQKINLLKNKIEEIQKLRYTFINKLIDLIKKELENYFNKPLEEFNDYLINYIPDVEIYD